MCRKKQGIYRKSAYWWNENIETLRIECHKARRQYQKGLQSTELTTPHERFKRNDLKAIKNNKTGCFKELCNRVEETPSADAYKFVMTKVKGHKGQASTCPSLLKLVVQRKKQHLVLLKKPNKSAGQPGCTEHCASCTQWEKIWRVQHCSTKHTRKRQNQYPAKRNQGSLQFPNSVTRSC